MKTIILCGGLGTRLSEETHLKPKPMVEIGGQPILWHIMKIYAKYGYTDFMLALGYKGQVIKEFMLNYHAMTCDLRVHLGNGRVEYCEQAAEGITVDLIDTGQDTMTGGRLHRLAKLVKPGGTFMLTYGDGVSDIDIDRLLSFHKSHSRLATLTAVRPTSRFGALELDGDRVLHFKEKPQAAEGWINGGFFVFEPGVFDYIDGDDTILEREPLENLARDGQLMTYRHDGFWMCMDTLRDKKALESMWAKGAAPWKIW